MTLDVRPVCLFCCQRFSLAAGQETTCVDPRAEGLHVERLRATKEDFARARKPAPAVEDEPIFDTSTLMDPDDEPIGMKWRQRKPDAFISKKAKPEPPPQMGFGL